MQSNKALKDAYKQVKFKMGVFQIRSLSNQKIFISSGVNLGAIWNRHKMELNLGTHRNEGLQEEWKAYGAGNFVFEVLAEIEQKDDKQVDYAQEVKKLEKMFIEELHPFGVKGYNNKPH